jgi:hypothetical protein
VNDCVNLLERYGSVYKVSYDPAYDAYHVPREKRDPWMMCLKGGRPGRVTIYPHGGTTLAVEVNHRQVVARAVMALPGARVHQDGGTRGEMTILVDVAHSTPWRPSSSRSSCVARGPYPTTTGPRSCPPCGSTPNAELLSTWIPRAGASSRL